MKNLSRKKNGLNDILLESIPEKSQILQSLSWVMKAYFDW